MRLAISNIAWERSEDEQVRHLLCQYEIDAIDIAPGKYFPDLSNVSDTDVANVRKFWAGASVEITGMQALLFGTRGLNMFGAPDVRDSMLRHLEYTCRVGEKLGVKRLTFGSPKNRDRGGITDDEVLAIAVSFFRQLGRIAIDHGVLVCLEPNPSTYGANFMTTTAEAAEIVMAVDHPGIRLQLDTGTMIFNRECPEAVLASYADLIGHIHLSEPELAPLGASGQKHVDFARALRAHLVAPLATIEMLAVPGEDHLAVIERALKSANYYYLETAAA